MFGVCMGNQLMGLAAGAKTLKMKYGNRGLNQPCVDLRTQRCHITSQNHGYVIDNESLHGTKKEGGEERRGKKKKKKKHESRGLNQPCIGLRTQRCHITSQNHRYVI